jgi:hypothetical protein
VGTLDVIILSGGQQKHIPSNKIIEALLNNSHVHHWFCQNPDLQGGKDPYHSKISPFPYGLQDLPHNRAGSERLLELYKQLFLNYTETSPPVMTSTSSTRTNGTSIYTGYIRTGPKLPNRDKVPHRSKSVSPEQYFADVAANTYILAPNGDRPECYRHLEAIGLGTVPITEMDPFLYRHLREGPVIYNTPTWDLDTLKETLDPHPIVNRNLVLEEYWMEYVDFEAGRPLRWWDIKHKRPSFLDEILLRTEETTV